MSFSTNRLGDHMRNEGLGEALIKDCEHIMQSELSDVHSQLKLHDGEQLNLLGPFQQHSEVIQ